MHSNELTVISAISNTHHWMYSERDKLKADLITYKAKLPNWEIHYTLPSL